jgi:hypothetical protein
MRDLRFCLLPRLLNRYCVNYQPVKAIGSVCTVLIVLLAFVHLSYTSFENQPRSKEWTLSMQCTHCFRLATTRRRGQEPFMSIPTCNITVVTTSGDLIPPSQNGTLSCQTTQTPGCPCACVTGASRAGAACQHGYGDLFGELMTAKLRGKWANQTSGLSSPNRTNTTALFQVCAMR